MDQKYGMDAFFCHQPLAMSMLDSFGRRTLEQYLLHADTYQGGLKRAYINTVFTDALLSYLERRKIPAIEELLTKGVELIEGTVVWVEGAFYFSGIAKAVTKLSEGSKPAYFSFSRSLDQFPKTIVGQLNAEHLCSTSALQFLSRRNRKFMLGFIQSCSEDEIILRTFLVGDRIIRGGINRPFQTSDLELDIEDIEEFKKVRLIERADNSLDLERNRKIPEQAIKRHIAEILGERHIEKDWGGESSDLFTCNLSLAGKRRKAAFVLKGPSHFKTMRMRDLGKNGDQLVRLFDEPADIFIVQHCHNVSQDVRKTVHAFASRVDRLSRYCIIDGIDTQRLLLAYNKLGLTSDSE
ncbi:hypothetical protein [Dyadobacter sp. OTU695]|uniref:hypothetical protein n=1 Tax=Dyadobacter sp. OTU695 TaxID=3043860 RepID=UPI00313DEC8B